MKRLFLVLLLCVAGAAFGHKPSDAYLTLERHDAQISGQWDIALRDLENALSLDANGDGEITWGEVRARQSDIAAYALARLEVASGGEVCPLSVTKHLIDQHSDGAYAVLKLSGVCPRPGPALAVTYRLFFDLDPMHRGLLQYVESGQSHSVIFSAEARTHTLGSGNWWEQFTAYV
ncbi:MAG TPA: HupE/UreJ family protein, partial [Casimicrobiaceae bacterium]|nr:HupE/UreJ family protein [Casimicrobiaceae bacterium]